MSSKHKADIRVGDLVYWAQAEVWDNYLQTPSKPRPLHPEFRATPRSPGTFHVTGLTGFAWAATDYAVSLTPEFQLEGA